MTTPRLEIEGNTAKIYGLTAQTIGAEPLGAVAAVRNEVITLSRQQITKILSEETLPVPIQNAINNLLRSGVQFVLGSDAPGDTYFRSASGPVARLGIGANGKILGVTSGLPSWIDAPSSIAWAEITTTTQAAAINSGYVANNAALLTFTLPSVAPLGSVIEIVGKGAGGWKLSQGASQRVHFGNVSSTAGAAGMLLSVHQRDSIRLVNVVADTEWQVCGSQGNIDVT